MVHALHGGCLHFLFVVFICFVLVLHMQQTTSESESVSVNSDIYVLCMICCFSLCVLGYFFTHV